jgi:hypothetical protein
MVPPRVLEARRGETACGETPGALVRYGNLTVPPNTGLPLIAMARIHIKAMGRAIKPSPSGIALTVCGK